MQAAVCLLGLKIAISACFGEVVTEKAVDLRKEPKHKKSQTEASQAKIGTDNRIAIVVGKKPITMQQIEARARLMLLSREPEKTGAPSDVLIKEAAQALVGECIKRNTCDRVKVVVKNEEVDEHIKKLAEQNGMDIKSMEQFFTSKGIPISTIRDSLYVQIAWPRAVHANVQVFVSDQEVQKALDTERASWNHERVELGEIVMYGDSPKQRDSALKRLQEIAVTLRKGTSVAVAAQQFSESSSAGNGGSIGWFSAGTLTTEEENALRSKPVGYCTDPLPCSGGYRLLCILDRQSPGELPQSQSHMACTVARLPFSPDWPYEKQEIFAHLVETLSQCRDEDSFQKQVTAWRDTEPGSKLEVLQPMALHELPPEVARLASAAQSVGSVVGPLRLPDNNLVLVFIRSKVRVKGQNKTTFENMQSQLYQKKMDTAARREFSHLRGHTAVEYLIEKFKPA